MSTSLPVDTFEALRWLDAHLRATGDRAAVVRLATRRLRAALAMSEAARRRCPGVVRALVDFLDRAEGSSLLRIYGGDLLREIACAVFGWDLRVSLLRDRPPPRRMLVLGETGVGKERIATLIGRTLAALGGTTGGAGGRFVAVSAAEFPETLLESELFGHESGAFTGAVGRREGLLSSLGDGGVLLLDEVAEASPATQAKLLRVLQTGEYRPVGAERVSRARFHLVAATNQPEPALRDGAAMRADLYHRLASPPLTVPPLRALVADPARARQVFDALVHHAADDMAAGSDPAARDEFIGWVTDAVGKRVARTIATGMAGYPWPGNLRECTNLIRRILYDGPEAAPRLMAAVRAGAPAPEAIGASAPTGADPALPMDLKAHLAAVEDRAYARAAAESATIDEVAAHLSVTRQTASRRLRRFGLRPTGGSGILNP